MMNSLLELQRDIEDELATFPSRTEDLRRMTRYERYPRMLYRTNLWIHGRRIAASLISAAPAILRETPAFDVRRALALALVHDDAELVMGDFQSSNRAIMDAASIAALDTREAQAIDVISSRYPLMCGGYQYKALLTDILEHGTVEAQVVKYFDKVEGYMEAVHEAFAGNTTFFERPPTEYGVPPNPYEYYPAYFERVYVALPQIAPYAGQDAFFGTPYTYSWEDVLRDAHVHSAESLQIPTGFALYDRWRDAQCATQDSAILSSLLTLQES